MLFLGRILDGISGGNISTAQAYIADITTKKDRAKGWASSGQLLDLGFIFGPVIGRNLATGVFTYLFFLRLVYLRQRIILYFTLPETVTPRSSRS